MESFKNQEDRWVGRRGIAALLLGLVWLTGCGGIVGYTVSGGGESPAPVPNTITGDWVFQLTPSTTEVAPFAQLVGSLEEQTATAGAANPLVALLQIQNSGSCYLGTSLLPLQGDYNAPTLGVYSFAVNGQYMTWTATADSTSTHLTGTYTVSGGCANGAVGTFAGTKYLPVTGSFTGTSTGGSSAATMTLALSTNASPNGDGSFSITGTAQFANLSCFTQGSVASGTALGNVVHLVLTTNETGGSHIALDGTFNSAATAITISSIAVTGGSCAGSLGSVNLAATP